MANPAQIEIVRRAYQLWQQAGEPVGRDDEFYHQAEEELRNKAYGNDQSAERSGESPIGRGPCARIEGRKWE